MALKYESVFTQKFPDKPANLPFFRIKTVPGATLPRHKGVRPQGELMMDAVNNGVDKLVEEKCINPCESDACAQVLLVKKPDGTWRFCIDYRNLNDITIPDSYPLPNIEEIITKLKGKALYSVIDLLRGYYQLGLHEDSRYLTAFITKSGVYEWLRVPMGAKNAPSYFQRMMKTIVLKGLDDICQIYMDDLIVYGDTKEQHWANLDKVLARLQKYGLVIKGEKCKWAQTELQYLGIVINKDGQRMSDSRKQALFDMPKPTTMTQLRSFMGAANYFHRFIRPFGEIAAPLHKLVKKGPGKALLQWTPEANICYEKMKEEILKAPTLKFLTDKGEIRLYTDASDIACGGYLCQVVDGQEMPVCYVSHIFSGAQINWSTCDKEMYAIVYAILRLHYFIADKQFIVRTDHRNLMYSTTMSGRVQRWRMSLADYSYTIEYIQREDNYPADTLTQLVPGVDPTQERDTTEETFENLMRPATGDDRLQVLRGDQPPAKPSSTAELLVNTRSSKLKIPATRRDSEDDTSVALDRQELDEDENYWPGAPENDLDSDSETETETETEPMPPVAKGPVRAEPRSPDMTFLVSKYHDGAALHPTAKEVLKALRKDGYSWPNMAKDVAEYVQSCDKCQRIKDKLKHLHGPQYTISASRMMEELAVDTIGPLPEDVDGNKYILVLVDAFSRWTELIPLKTATASEAAEAILGYVTRYGTPTRISSDNGSQFINELMADLRALLQCDTISTLPRNHVENGIVENRIRFVRRLMGKYDHQPLSYSLACAFIRRALNSREHPSLGLAPADLMFGEFNRLKARLFSEETRPNPSIPYDWPSHYWEVLDRQEILLEQARDQLLRTQGLKPVKKASPNPFKIGDWILVEVDGSVKTGLDQREGPYQVSHVTDGNVSYESTRFAGRTFTAPIGVCTRYSVRPGSDPRDAGVRKDARFFVVEKILAHRIVQTIASKSSIPKKKEKPTLKNTQVLIKWQIDDRPTWEPLSEPSIRRLVKLAQYIAQHPELSHLLPKSKTS